MSKLRILTLNFIEIKLKKYENIISIFLIHPKIFDSLIIKNLSPDDTYNLLIGSGLKNLHLIKFPKLIEFYSNNNCFHKTTSSWINFARYSNPVHLEKNIKIGNSFFYAFKEAIIIEKYSRFVELILTLRTNSEIIKKNTYFRLMLLTDWPKNNRELYNRVKIDYKRNFEKYKNIILTTSNKYDIINHTITNELSLTQFEKNKNILRKDFDDRMKYRWLRLLEDCFHTQGIASVKNINPNNLKVLVIQSSINCENDLVNERQIMFPYNQNFLDHLHKIPRNKNYQTSPNVKLTMDIDLRDENYYKSVNKIRLNHSVAIRRSNND